MSSITLVYRSGDRTEYPLDPGDDDWALADAAVKNQLHDFKGSVCEVVVTTDQDYRAQAEKHIHKHKK